MSVLTKWQLRFVRLACEVATWSKDQDCAVGAVLVSPDHRSVSPGYNGFPRSLEDSAELIADKQQKNLRTVHAELNAIFNARSDVRGWHLYCTKPSCHECAKHIIQAGVATIVMPTVDLTSSWAGSQALAVEWFAEARINVVQFDPGLIQTEFLARGL